MHSQKIIKFYDDSSEWYDLTWFARMQSKSISVADFAMAYDRLLKKYNAERVLDCACGTGFPAIQLYMMKNRPYSIAGSDGSSGMIKICRQKAVRKGINISERITDINVSLVLVHSRWQDLNKNFKKNSFDFVMCQGNSFYHLVSRQSMLSVLSSMSQILSPGGCLLIDTKHYKTDAHGLVCGEEGREFTSDYGWFEFYQNDNLYMPPEMKTKKHLFICDETEYSENKLSISGVIQKKTFFIKTEKDGKLDTVKKLFASGAAFTSAMVIGLLKETGFPMYMNFR